MEYRVAGNCQACIRRSDELIDALREALKTYGHPGDAQVVRSVQATLPAPLFK
jgi:hypothetical protein